MKTAYTVLILGLLLFANAAFAQTLQSAVLKNDTVAVLSLIKGGARVNEADDNGSTPLMQAARWGSTASARLLLNNGATVDVPRTKTGRTPLIITCAYYGGSSMVKLLLEKGADVNAKTNDGLTALMYAAKNSKADVVEYLLAHGADATLKDAKGQTALDYAKNADLTLHASDVPDARLDKDDCILRLQRANGK